MGLLLTWASRATWVAPVMLVAGLAASPTGAQAATVASDSMSIQTRVEARLEVVTDRDVVRLEPGETAAVAVTVKTRLARGGAVDLIVATDLDDAWAPLVGVSADGVAAPATTARFTIHESGVSTRTLLFELSPEAPGPVIFRVDLRATWSAAF